MKEIAVIDVDFIGRKNHRFPNLCCMKISGYFKADGCKVELKTDYDNLDAYQKVYVAKVFTDTPTPKAGLFGDPLDAPNVIKGGTGFYFDHAEPLPPQIEHAMPDYHLYDAFSNFKTYTDYSIGFLTRGCFRHCPFCVNRRSSKVVAHSPLKEFYDSTRPKICLLDDNFFGFEGWKDLLLELRTTGKPFVFQQGLDVRLLDEKRAELLFSSRYDGDFIFGCLSYVMRHKNYLATPKRIQWLYTRLAEWANQPHLFLKKSFAEFLAYAAHYRENQRRRHRPSPPKSNGITPI